MNEIKCEFSDNICTLYFSGHIDSNNASLVEEEANTFLNSHPAEQVLIDVKDLEYISSAGLRVLLHIRKQNENLRITNCRTEIYEILEMTGFTQMMTIEKAYREVSVEGCEVIGEGANGKIYRIDKDNVVKVYNRPDALSDIQNEREMARTALVLGIPTAISYDVVKVNGHYGSVFELLNARSFANILIDEPEKTDWCVTEFTKMLNKIHSTVVPSGKLPDIKKTALGWVEFLKEYLPADAYQKLHRLVRDIPQDDHMIHGDYHIKNLELTNDEVLLIDMDTLAVGHPIFELAAMYNAFIGFGEYDHQNIMEFFGISYEKATEFFHRVLSTYLASTNESFIQEVADKARVIGYARMIRRSIRRKGLESEEKRAEIELWKDKLLELLPRFDTLLFNRNEIEVDAKSDYLREVLSFVDGHLDSVGCNPKIKMQIDVAVEEIFINIASYAYPKGVGKALIRAEADKDPSMITISLSDSGIPFDPLEHEDPDVTMSAKERQIGGLGIFMVKKTMDELNYEYKDGRNIFTMKKLLH